MRPEKMGAHRTNYERNKKRILATQNTCGICGRPVDFSLKVPHPMSAVIDHIIPVSKGGHPIVDNLDVPVICYGLKNDFRNELFEGTKALLLYADEIREIEAVCYFCDRKANMNMRWENGRPVFKGEQIRIGGSVGDKEVSEVVYIPVCRKCYISFKKNFN